MDTNQDREEPSTSRPLGDFERDPLKLAQSLAEDYGRLAAEREGPGGTRDQLNLHLQRSYLLAFYYNQNPEEYAEFQSHPYLSDTRQKTRARNIPFTVLKFTMQAKGNKQRLNRIYKRARVLEYLLTQDVLPEEVAGYLKREGGVDPVYGRLNAAKKLRRRKMLADEHRIDRADPDLAEIVSARSEDDDDECAMSVESAAADHDLATASSDQRKVHEVSRERNNPLDDGLALPDARRELIVEMDPLDLERVRDSVGGQIHFTVGPPSESDWWRVRGEIVSLERRDGQSSPLSGGPREVVAPPDTT